MECLPGHRQSLAGSEITSCVAECNYPSTILNGILPKGTITPCQLALWGNKQIHQVSINLLDNTQRPTSSTELNALKQLYKALNGDLWLKNSNWKNNDPCINKWHGIVCNLIGNIISITFTQNGLHGIIPDSIIDLTHLKHLYVLNTLFENSLPSANSIFKVSPNVFLLPELNEIMLMNVNLKQDLASMITMGAVVNPSIEIINLSFNRLFGVMPSFDSFPQLKILNLSFNDIKGDLSMLNTLSSTVYDISLHNNLFSGTIPNLNNVMHSLEYFDIRNTTVTGTVPSNLISENFFVQLKYLGLMMTNITLPNECKDTPFCIKKIMKNRRSINDAGFDLIAEDLKYLHSRP